ncbi:hypothetical protein KG104_11825 [Arthrobacter sunyaminii]|uniref:Uncharacterized protein n=1 Tax=Arthrobacter sunyaminii TaxID=2816859 RepID=A0A975S982_9MICC|nr:hypothetical protein [Arthrobacter sunyaminii]MBO0907625.1 hypothetical protein [Arthrobacter sunyaminii]QWQ38143.1 hypothetical protein KG104_11825 [Arthrobacter sunyaminii]
MPVTQVPVLQPGQRCGVGGAQPSRLTHQHLRGVRRQVQDGCGFLRGQAKGQGRILPANIFEQVVTEEDFHPVQHFGLLGLRPPHQRIQPGQHHTGFVLGQGLRTLQDQRTGKPVPVGRVHVSGFGIPRGTVRLSVVNRQARAGSLPGTECFTSAAASKRSVLIHDFRLSPATDISVPKTAPKTPKTETFENPRYPSFPEDYLRQVSVYLLRFCAPQITVEFG